METNIKHEVEERLKRSRQQRAAASKRVKVAILIEATIGGTREHLRQIARRINLRRFDVTVICSTLREADFNRDVERMRKWGLNVITLPMQREIHPLQDLMAFFTICRHFNRRSFDVVHTHCSKAGFLGRLAATVSRVPRILHTPHTFAFQSQNSGRWRSALYRFLERFAGIYTHKLILLTEPQRALAVQEGLVHPSRTVVLPNGVPIKTAEEIAAGAAERSALGLNAEDRVIGCVARLAPQKGLEHLLAVAETVCSECPKAVFVVVGEGELRRDLEADIEKRGLTGKVRLIGQREDVMSLYPVFDALVMTSHYEGLPYTILEAMASMCPVAAFAIPELEAVIREGETGLLAAPGDTAGLAAQLVRLINETELAARLERQAFEHVSTHCSIDRFIQALEALYLGEDEAG